MPLVRIATRETYSETQIKQIGELVYEAMRTAFNVPENDHFQILTRHSDDTLVYDDNYLGISRSDGIVLIQVTLNQGRSVELKKQFYQQVADSLNEVMTIRKEDVFINLVEVAKENWSFGNGIAQYAE